MRAAEVEDECCGYLEQGLPNYHLPHGEGNDRRGPWCGLAVEDFLGWRIGGKGERGEGIPNAMLVMESAVDMVGAFT